nr:MULTISPECIES: flagellar biosynthetic protein FliO [unclassified Ochrobactrum]
MKEWLSGIVGESAANIVGFILIFAIILCGIFVVLSIIRRFSGGTYVSNGRTRQPRLSVMDAAAVDSRRKLVLIRRDDVEHLLLIGGPTDVVVEQNIVMESRAHARVQPSRIEPEHIERFKQHEVLTNEKTPALSLQTPPANEKDEAIQLSSAIETPAYRKPEPAREEPAPQAPTPVHVPPQAPAVASRASQSPVEPKPAQPVQVRPQPRPAPNYPPQPRTVLPPRPVQAQPQSTRAHPAYPLSQVSRGVVSSTSSGGVTTTGVAAVTSVASANLGSIVPERETTVADKSPSLDVTGPTVSTTAAPAFSTPSEPKRIEPEIPIAASKPAVSEPVSPEPPTDDLADLGNALQDAITADINSQSSASEESKEAASFDTEFFENELLSSLDISATDDALEDKTKDDIEDEMEKLLGELTKDGIRRD